MNNWTVLTNEEMLYVKGGMLPDEDPATLAVADPTAFGDVLEDTTQTDLMHWFEKFGYNKREARRVIRRYRRRMRRGGC